MKGRGSLATCRERSEHYPTKQLYSAVSKMPKLTLKMSRKTTTGPTHFALYMTPTRYKQPHPCGKTTHLSEEGKRHQDHMVEVLIRSWRRNTRQGDGTTPTLRSTEVSAVPHGPALGGGSLSQVCILFRGPPGERGRPDSVLQQPCYVIM